MKDHGSWDLVRRRLIIVWLFGETKVLQSAGERNPDFINGGLQFANGENKRLHIKKARQVASSRLVQITYPPTFHLVVGSLEPVAPFWA